MNKILVNLEKFRENLIKTDLSRLYKEMKEDKELYKLLNMTANEFANSEERQLRKYSYLLDEVGYSDYTLLELIGLTFIHSPQFVSCFLEDSGKLTGFVAYAFTINRVTNFKMFSFKPEYAESKFREDLKIFLKNLITSGEYEEIVWSAFPENPANIYYKDVIKKYNGETSTTISKRTGKVYTKYCIKVEKALEKIKSI
jgi:hypothetical protein